jgi:hypothetical protein
MSTHPVAIRFDEALLDDVKRWAKANGTTVSAAVQGFSAESLRMRQVPGIVFRDGPAGRRAAVEGSLDVWEVVEGARGIGQAGAGEQAVADELGLPRRVVEVALDYYARFPDEVEERIAENARAADEARALWERRRAALA